MLEGKMPLGWRVENRAMDENNPFEGCDTKRVLEDVGRAVTSPETQSLWDRILEERQHGGKGAVTTYLGGEFTRIKQDFLQELTRVTGQPQNMRGMKNG
jgi:hypothetical protein